MSLRIDRRRLIQALGAAASLPGLPTLARADDAEGRSAQRVDVADLGLFRSVSDDDPDLLAKAKKNAALLTEAARELSRRGGGEIVFPRQETFRVAASPYEGGQRGGFGWGQVAWALDDVHNVAIRGNGSTLERCEAEATGAAGDPRNATVGVYRSSAILFERLILKGKSRTEVQKYTTGNNWDISFASRDVTLRECEGGEGTNALAALGLNIDKPRHARGYAIDQPVSGIKIERCLAYNGEHGLLLNCCEDVEIDGFRHQARDHRFGGALQEPFIQRGLFFLACRKVSARNILLEGAHKTSIFFVVAAKSRAPFDLTDVRISNFEIRSPGGLDDDGVRQDENRYEAVVFHDQTGADLSLSRTASRIALVDGIIENSKTAVRFRDRKADARAAPAYSDVRFRNVQARTLARGVYATTFKPLGGASFENCGFSVFSDPSVGDAAPVAGFRVTRADRKSDVRHADVRLQNVMVRAGAIASEFEGVDGLVLRDLDTGYVRDKAASAKASFSPEAVDLRIVACRAAEAPRFTALNQKVEIRDSVIP
ncbi:hypothetical protein [Chenggangzhangella methanolivorans]|uniref:Uncharacterized protein n=1 Tax=Chenggangzhangella methanolivorans TaxID=1437009 RepID=A0A9E6RA05_9HYPH|nr:hypothetical protein [Chenggangzhangella methanolivorans]QZO00938.1 hypothetical protein K6K41_04795 [Chenggangzhangella methanolivorans]